MNNPTKHIKQVSRHEHWGQPVAVGIDTLTLYGHALLKAALGNKA